ncbi:hypothetical protein PENSPDRAFT_107889 [Peniophora sp. CONT]|nr:hypothetical protein PENSPDRAFT_107889 [Peniophora sp. CONT]
MYPKRLSIVCFVQRKHMPASSQTGALQMQFGLRIASPKLEVFSALRCRGDGQSDVEMCGIWMKEYREASYDLGTAVETTIHEMLDEVQTGKLMRPLHTPSNCFSFTRLCYIPCSFCSCHYFIRFHLRKIPCNLRSHMRSRRPNVSLCLYRIRSYS